MAGSTGEAAALYDAEYDALLRSAVDTFGARRTHVPVLAGTGLSNTAKTIALTRRAAELGADAALVVTPPYVRPTQAGLVAHYRAVADDGALPVVLYNVPGRTGCDLLPETVAELAPHPNIIGDQGSAQRTRAHGRAAGAARATAFAVLSGDDPTACRAMLAGADGVISVASNVLPRSFRRLVDLARVGPARPGRSLGRAPAGGLRLPGRRAQSDSGQGDARAPGHRPRPAPAAAVLVGRPLRKPPRRSMPTSAPSNSNAAIRSRPEPAGDLHAFHRFLVPRRVPACCWPAWSPRSGCSWFRKANDLYAQAPETRPLEVPPDLDQPNVTNAVNIPVAGSARRAPRPAPCGFTTTGTRDDVLRRSAKRWARSKA